MGSSAYEPHSPIPSATGVKEVQHGASVGATSSSRPIDRTPGSLDAVEKILEKAQSNSTRTDVIETIAPGKFPALDCENGLIRIY